MSFPIDLDELTEKAILGELALRKSLRARGLCDYCHRRVGELPSCKFPERHNPPKPPKRVRNVRPGGTK
jgi:hypothetical protein